MTGNTPNAHHVPITLTIDVGGQGIKGRTFRSADEPLCDRIRIKTPRPATPDAVVSAIAELLEQLRPFDRVTVGFPGVVFDGVVKTAPNLDGAWNAFDLQEQVKALAGAPTRVVNDADMQGYGAIEGRGVEMVITLGTGMGSALYVDGHSIPNLELGHHPFEKGRTYEERLGQTALDQSGKVKWNARVERAVLLMRRIFNFRRLYIGGGNARAIRFDLPDDVVVVQNAIAFVGGVKIWR